MAAGAVDYVIINVRRNLVEFTLAQDCECCRLSSSASNEFHLQQKILFFIIDAELFVFCCVLDESSVVTRIS